MSIYFEMALLGMAIGLVLGLYGSGGSILILPVLIYALGFEVKTAIPLSLTLIGATALIGAIQQWRQNTLCLKAALLFGSSGIVGSFAGARLSAFLTGQQQMFFFAILMLIVALDIIRQIIFQASPPNNTDGKEWTCSISPAFAGLLGGIVGLLTGLLGVGGGFLIVPALMHGGLGMHMAVGTSLLIIFLNSLAGTLGYWGQFNFDPLMILSFLACSGACSMMASKLSKRLPARGMKLGFAIFLLLISLYTFLKTQEVL